MENGQIVAWVTKLVEESGAAERFRQEGAATEREIVVRYLRSWNKRSAVIGEDPHVIAEAIEDGDHLRPEMW